MNDERKVYLKKMEGEVFSYEVCKLFQLTGVPQEFSVGALFWDDSYDPPWLRVWIDGMERERGCPRAFTLVEIRAIFSLKRGGGKITH
jgi:hypothetical protein